MNLRELQVLQTNTIIFYQIIFVLHLVKHRAIMVNGMVRKYDSPRYKNKSRPGRKPLPDEERRKLITARVAPETFKYFAESEMKVGLIIDLMVKKEMLGLPSHQIPSNHVHHTLQIGGKKNLKTGLRETSNFDNESLLDEDPYDVITEHARGLLAFIFERGTGHLTEDQIEQLSESFTNLVNQYIATFRKRS
jgi:hypothetical protein